MYSLTEMASSGIPPLLKNVSTLDQWRRKRESILNVWLESIGGIPPLVEVEVDIVSWVIFDDHLLIKVRYSSVHADWVPANILVPVEGEPSHKLLAEEDIKHLLFQGGNTGGNTYPAVLALHPTSEVGKNDISLSSGRENRTYARELVRRGYIVLAPDTITAGERILPNEKPFHTAPFYNQHPEWSAVAKMISDHRQGISLLETINLVNSEKIGAIGHSLGGYNAYFLAGIDSRIKAAVCSCGFSTFAGDPETHRWGKRDWFSHIPRISEYINNGKVPYEFNEIAALAAPIPLFFWMGQSDKIFPHWQPAAQGLADLAALYSWLGEEGKFVSLIGNSGHDFPPEIRELAYSFLDHWLYANED
ncbi:dipeptidyl aminopeptidase [Bacillus sp. FJAT-18017]|uniref:alpha/beta hydrolase family protein n=1 Tax=Bacillus sp. FJAT-18017 TaxID=1705566 RepID=UPI0006AEE5DD|nr:dienelactone hydrolase family protein [Bacillus sp. FJAT-18017]ALC92210.1 dipeptidyl aminopeptidase [Bacillus sp. FJAT-18017]